MIDSAAAVWQTFTHVKKSPIPFLRSVAKSEAISFLLLLGVAMPLKYFANLPIAVKIVGSIHGALFVLFCVALLRTMLIAKWPLSRGAIAFIASLIPFGPFVVDRRMAQYDAEFQAQGPN